MRRLVIRFAVVVLILGIVVGIVDTAVLAQEATPDPEMTEDITVLTTDLGILDSLPNAPAVVRFYRLEFPAGATLSFEPGDPGLGFWTIASGTLTLRDFTGDIQVTRVDDRATPGAQASEVLPAGTETQLGPGEGFVWPPILGGEVRNDGSAPVILWTVDLRTQEAIAATPTP